MGFFSSKKLKALKEILIKWNKEEFGKIEVSKQRWLKPFEDAGVERVARLEAQVEFLVVDWDEGNQLKTELHGSMDKGGTCKWVFLPPVCSLSDGNNSMGFYDCLILCEVGCSELYERDSSYCPHQSFNNLNQLGLEMWKLIPVAICWTIWEEHNQHTFNGLSAPLSKLVDSILSKIFEWLSFASLCSQIPFWVWIFEWDSLIFNH